MTVSAIARNGVKMARHQRTLSQHTFVRGATAMPLGVVGGAALGWLSAAPTEAARLEQTLFMSLFIGFVLAPSLAAALAAARYQRPAGPLSRRLRAAILVPAIGGAAWGLLGSIFALALAPLLDLQLPLPTFPAIAAGIGIFFGVVSGALTLLVRSVSRR